MNLEKFVLMKLTDESDKEIDEVNVYKSLAKAHYISENVEKGNFYNELFYRKNCFKI